MATLVAFVNLFLLTWLSEGFKTLPVPTTTRHFHVSRSPRTVMWLSTTPEDGEEEEKPENPYQDPNYPDLEFVNYDDPEYMVDQGEDTRLENSTEEEIEKMREERRLRNDEYQFQTYFQKVCRDGAIWKGDWTIYETLYLDDLPKLTQTRSPLQVDSWATKSRADKLIDERITHSEEMKPDLVTPDANTEKDADFNLDQYYTTYWPDSLEPFDFRGKTGIMVCGNAWTISVADDKTMRTELGIAENDMRFRIKLDYAQELEDESLLLRYMTVCRETVGRTIPREVEDEDVKEALFGTPGADGGLYDPPPVSEGLLHNYMKLNLPGHATVLIPFRVDHEERDEGWVTSLDWTPGEMRYQVDRKVHAGSRKMELRSLELSEVQSVDADTYRPRDGGADMRQ